MRHFLLVHGSWHGAWCWYKIAARLRSEGHTVTLIDLPGRGANKTKPVFIGMKSMLTHVLTYCPQNEKITTIVHSRYGVLASQLAEALPDRIERTIYLASFMLPSGKAVMDYSRKDKASRIGPFVEVNKLGLWDWLRPEAYREVLYHDCCDDDVALASSLLCREPSRPAITRLKLTEQRYGRVPRAYIRLTQDRAVSLALQDRLIEETTVERVESIDASHSAYFSKPDELTDKIIKLSGS